MLLGSELLGLPWAEFVKWIGKQTAKELFILVPDDSNINTEFYRIFDRAEYYECQGVNCTTIIKLNKETWSTMLTKHSMNLGAKTLHIEQTNRVLGLRLISMVIMSNNIAASKYGSPCNMVNSSKVLFTINTPQLAMDKSIFDQNKTIVSVDTRLYRHLSFRVVTEQCTFEELLAYARTYMQTTTYTQSGYYKENLDHITNLHIICACVYHEYEQKKIQWSYIAEKNCGLNKLDQGVVLEKLKTNLIQAGMKLLQTWKIDDRIVADIKSLATNVIGAKATNYANDLLTM
jgi:hypothetical protein